MPTDIMPTFRYRDCAAAITWLVDVLGCTEGSINGDPTGVVGHGELSYGTGMLMVGSFPDQVSGDMPDMDLGHASTYLINDDEAAVERTWQATQDAQAPVVQPFTRQPYGGVSFTVRDPEGQYWTVGSYRPAV